MRSGDVFGYLGYVSAGLERVKLGHKRGFLGLELGFHRRERIPFNLERLVGIALAFGTADDEQGKGERGWRVSSWRNSKRTVHRTPPWHLGSARLSGSSRCFCDQQAFGV